MQICRSRPEGGNKADNAIAINVRAVQETSGFGRSWQSKKEAFSDGHDVVLVPIQWGNRRESKNSAAQPVSLRVRVEQFETKATKRSSPNVDPEAVALVRSRSTMSTGEDDTDLSTDAVPEPL